MKRYYLTIDHPVSVDALSQIRKMFRGLVVEECLRQLVDTKMNGKHLCDCKKSVCSTKPLTFSVEILYPPSIQLLDSLKPQMRNYLIGQTLSEWLETSNGKTFFESILFKGTPQ
jgi:hypothetical protein